MRYEDACYWEMMISNNYTSWNESLTVSEIDRNSKFIYTAILNERKGIFREQWMSFPDRKAMLGFIQHVFIPTAFFTCKDSFVEDFVVPLGTIDYVIEKIQEGGDVVCKCDKSFMEKIMEKMNRCWLMNEQECMKEIGKISKEYNRYFQEMDGQLMFFKTFNNTYEIADYIFPDDEDFFEEVMEESLEMDKSEWENLCKDVYEKKFINRRFLDILNLKCVNLV